MSALTRVLLLALALGGVSEPAQAEPYALSWGGRITDGLGKPLAGPVDIHVGFYRAETGGAALAAGPLVFSAVPLTNGVFSLKLTLDPDEFHQVFSSLEDPVFIEIVDATNS